MKPHFNCTEIVRYNDTNIQVHWTRNEYKMKSNVKIFGTDSIVTVEKDYISFAYNGIRIQDRYESDEYALEGRVYDICSVIDSGKYEELTEMNVDWKRIK